MAARPAFRPAVRTTAELHRAWLSLVDTDGPFLAIPPLCRVWSTGMPPLSDDAKGTLVAAKPPFEAAWDRWDRRRDDTTGLTAYCTARDEWVTTVLRDVVGWGEMLVNNDPALSRGEVTSPDGAVTVAPTMSLRHADDTGALVWVVDPVDSLRDPLTDGWSSSPIDRMEQMLRASGVAIGIVTDGRWWALVSAADKVLPASGIVDAQTWVEEPATRNAVITLLSRQHLVGGREEDRLPALFAESVLAAELVTERLGVQVRAAVELIVQALSEVSSRVQSHGDPDPLPADGDQIYDAVVTLMMRVVFLLFAEERGLVPQGQLFSGGYGLSDRLDVLDARARLEGEEALDSTHLTWHRLLAASHALHRGATFEDMRLPAYGGSLFDPERFPFLTAVTERGALAVSVSDRVMWHVLQAVQVARVKGQDARRVSFRAIDVEQIGYVYEGLLGYTCQRAERLTVGLVGKAGAEPEMSVDELDDLAEEHVEDREIAEAIRAWTKDNQPASQCSTMAALTKALAAGDTMEDADRALRAVTADADLRGRLRPWIGVIRRDLRGRPVVILPGGLVVTETPSRRNAGAHYTPKALAEEVVHHALEPLCYRPGPHQSADTDQWRRIGSTEILDLKVADIACGSGAFLVAAANYLAARLVEAREEEGSAVLAAHELQTKALREVVARCLYGADINPMAVEMCKLSLWLVSLDRDLPFSFVDDKVLHGNSLLGLTSRRQLEELHIDPSVAPRQGRLDVTAAGELVDRLDISVQIGRAITLRRQLATEIDEADPQRTAAAKRRQLADAHRLTARLSLVADGVIAAGLPLGGRPGKALNEAYDNLRRAVIDAVPASGEGDPSRLEGAVDRGLTPSVDTDYRRWKPLHWILEVPDVMERGGFDAVIGNPPFLGAKKLTPAMGFTMRQWFVHTLADGTVGNADLVAYFFLRAMTLLTPRGFLGLIATNTLAQGDTREVGLDRMVESGFTITRSIQSRSWPVKSANLEYAAVWGTRGPVNESVRRVSDDVEVPAISSLLEPEGRVQGSPSRLAENAGTAFIGSNVNCVDEFSMAPDHAASLISANPGLTAVIRPYLGGRDVNQEPTLTATRWIVDFTHVREPDLPSWGEAHAWVHRRVRPARQGLLKNKPKLAERWWVYEAPGLKMRKAIARLDEVLVIALVSKTVMPVRVATGQVFSHALGVFATDSFADQAVLSSSLHQMWAIKYGSGMRSDPRYTPSDVFETFPRPLSAEGLAEIGRVLDQERREIMLRRDLGLTKLYNLVNDPDIGDSADPDVARMRESHVELDRAVMAAYGWSDVTLDQGFHTYRQMERWTVSPAARVEILDRLLEENHRRAAAQGQPPPPPEDEETSDDTTEDGEA